MTQIISNLMSIFGAFLLVFSTWQYTITAPTCCHDSVNASIAHQFNGKCTEFETSIVLEEISFHIPATLNMILAIVGLTVSYFSSAYDSYINIARLLAVARVHRYRDLQNLYVTDGVQVLISK